MMAAKCELCRKFIGPFENSIQIHNRCGNLHDELLDAAKAAVDAIDTYALRERLEAAITACLWPGLSCEEEK